MTSILGLGVFAAIAGLLEEEEEVKKDASVACRLDMTIHVAQIN